MASLTYAAGAGSRGLLYSVGPDCVVCALDAATGSEVMRFKAGGHALSCVGAAPDRQSVLVASSSLALWSVVRQKRLAKFMGHTVSLPLLTDARMAGCSSRALPHPQYQAGTGRVVPRGVPLGLTDLCMH